MSSLQRGDKKTFTCAECGVDIEAIASGDKRPYYWAATGGARRIFSSGPTKFLCALCGAKREAEDKVREARSLEARKATEAQAASEEAERLQHKQSLWIEFYCKNGITKRIEGIEKVKVNGHWISVFALDGTRLNAHCETYHTNLTAEDFWEGQDGEEGPRP